MKRILIMTMLALLTVATSVQAQFHAGTWSIQPKIGFGSSWMTNQPNLPIETEIPDADFEMKKTLFPSFNIGAEAEYQLTDQFSLAAGLNYTLLGGKWKDFNMTLAKYRYEITNTRLELGYITLPILVNYYFTENFAIKTGVQLGYLTNAHLKSKMTDINLDTKVSDVDALDEGMNNDFNKLDIAIPVGVSYQFSNNWYLEGKYSFSFTRINKEKDEDGDMRNNNFLVTLGYKIKL